MGLLSSELTQPSPEAHLGPSPPPLSGTLGLSSQVLGQAGQADPAYLRRSDKTPALRGMAAGKTYGGS